MNKVTLAYHGSAATEADRVFDALRSLGWDVVRYVCGGGEPGSLGKKLQEVDRPTILLLNDELLHGLHCQIGLLDAYRNLRHSGRLTVALASSQRKGPNGSEARVLTSLSRVSDVIRYMNYWQHAYLDRRRELGSLPPEQATERLEPVRTVSQEIGETLRLVRADGYVSVHELTTENASLLRQRLGQGSSTPQAPQNAELPKQQEATPIEASPGVLIIPGPTVSTGVTGIESDSEAVAEAIVPVSEPNTSSEPDEQANFDEEQPAAAESIPASISSMLAEIVGTVAASVETAEQLRPSSSEHVVEIAATKSDPEARQQPTLSSALAIPTDAGTDGETGTAVDAAKTRKRGRKRTVKHFVKLLNQGDPGEAFSYAEAQLHKDLHNNRLRYAYAIGLLELGDDRRDFAEAQRQLTALTSTEVGAPAHLALGLIALSERDYGAARRHLKRAYKLDKRVDTELPYRLGALLQDEFPEKRKAARRLLRVATRCSIENVGDAWYRLGYSLVEQGDWRAAARALKTACSLDRKHPFAAYDLANLYLERDRIAKAARYYRQAVAINPELDTAANRAAFAPPAPELEHDGFDRYLSDAQQAPSAVTEEVPVAALVPQPAETPKPVAPAPAPVAAAAPVSSEEDAVTVESLLAQEWQTTKLTVLVTGASSGIGLATARIFAAGGHRLILAGRRVSRLRELSAELVSQHQVDVRLLSFDVTHFSETSELLNTLPEDWRDIDVLINNAGKAKGLSPIHEGRIEHWEEMIDTNIKGVLYMIRLVAPGMVARGGGQIINTCSTAGHEVYPNGAVYCATKHAVDAITQGARLDLHKHNIRVGQVSPAHVEETEFASVRFDGDDARAASVYQNFQPLRAGDVARSIYFMATQPLHVNVQDVLMLGTQQASSTVINRSGR